MKRWPRSSSTVLTKGRVRGSFPLGGGSLGMFSRCFFRPGLSSSVCPKSGRFIRQVVVAREWSQLSCIRGELKMRKLVYVLFVGLLLLSLGSGNAFAQATASATIQGTVTDKSGAVVSGAHVVAKNKATDVSRTTTTSDEGYYRFELLPVGTYTVTVSRAGFGTVAQTIETLIGQTATVNAQLSPGATSEVIEVTSEAPLVDQLKTSVSQNITPSEVEELPLLGRDVANLAYLAPGVKATDSYDPTKNRYAILSVNGQSGRNVNVTVNGVDNKDNTVGGPVMQVPLEAVQEFLISTPRFSAASRRSAGAAINMITQTGTTQHQ